MKVGAFNLGFVGPTFLSFLLVSCGRSLGGCHQFDHEYFARLLLENDQL